MQLASKSISCNVKMPINKLTLNFHSNNNRKMRTINNNINHQNINLVQLAKLVALTWLVEAFLASIQDKLSTRLGFATALGLPHYVNHSSSFFKPLEQSQFGHRTNQQQHLATSLRPAQQAMQAATAPPTTTTTSAGLNSAECAGGLLSFELSTGFIYKPAASETLATLPSTLQLTDCLGFCLANSSCMAINFEMGLCVLLSSSVKHNASQLYSSQFPVFTIYAEKLCLFSNSELSAKQRRRCPRAWTFERLAGFELKLKPRRRLKLATKELCMEACLGERDFECRSANWYRHLSECALSDQDRHSLSQQLNNNNSGNSSHTTHNNNNSQFDALFGPSNSTTPTRPPAHPPGLYQNYYHAAAKELVEPEAALAALEQQDTVNATSAASVLARRKRQAPGASSKVGVDYLENNCIQEPNKLCEFGKIANRVLKTVDSIYQDVGSLEECKQRCLGAPYRCHSFDYGDTSERVCRTSHLDRASLTAIKEPYLEVAGAVTYELQACFNVSVACNAREMVVHVASSKMFRGRIYAKARPNSCLNDVAGSLKFELALKYHEPQLCDVKLTTKTTTPTSSNQTLISSNQGRQQQHQQGMFSTEIVIQHHDRIVTSQDVGLQVFCQYDLSERSVVSTVDLAVERLGAADASPVAFEPNSVESKTSTALQQMSQQQQHNQNKPITITSLATTVVKSPNVAMKITNLNGTPVQSATVGDRLALMFEIKDKTTPFGIFVRDIIAMDGKQLQQMQQQQANANSTATLDDFVSQKAGAAQTVQLIDADGCPTDANIMGQLVRLDTAGRRYLAPFDAFKFPSSDVVFFRAVITTCVAECRIATACSPAAAPGQASQLDSMAEFTNRSAPLSTPSLDSTASTRNLLINNQASSTSTTTTTTLTTEFSSASPTTPSSVANADETPAAINVIKSPISANHNDSLIAPLIQTNRDSTTTVAGFGSQTTKPAQFNANSTTSTATTNTFNLANEGEKFALDGVSFSNGDSNQENQLNFPLGLQSLVTTPSSLVGSPLPQFPTSSLPGLASPAHHATLNNWHQQQYNSNNNNDIEREPESRSSVSPHDFPPIEILNDLQRDLLVKLLKETRRRVAIDATQVQWNPTAVQANSTRAPSDLSPTTNNQPLADLSRNNNLRNSDTDNNETPEASNNNDNKNNNSESLVAQIDKLVARLEQAAAKSKSAKQRAEQQINELSTDNNEVTTINIVNLGPDSTTPTSSLNYSEIPEHLLINQTTTTGLAAAPGELANLTAPLAATNNNIINEQLTSFEKALDETLQEQLNHYERIARQAPISDDASASNDAEVGSITQSQKRNRRDTNSAGDRQLALTDKRLYREEGKWDPSLDHLIKASIFEANQYQENNNQNNDHETHLSDLRRVKRGALLQPVAPPQSDDSLLVQSIKIMDRMEFDKEKDKIRDTPPTQQQHQQQQAREFVAKNSLVTSQNRAKQRADRVEFSPSETDMTPDSDTHSIHVASSDSDHLDSHKSSFASLFSRSAAGNSWTTLSILLVIASVSFFVIQFLLIFTFAYWSSKTPQVRAGAASRVASKPIRALEGHSNPAAIMHNPYVNLAYNNNKNNDASVSPGASSTLSNQTFLCPPSLSSTISTSSSLHHLTGNTSNGSSPPTINNGRRTITTISGNWISRPLFANSHCAGRRQFR